MGIGIKLGTGCGLRGVGLRLGAGVDAGSVVVVGVGGCCLGYGG